MQAWGQPALHSQKDSDSDLSTKTNKNYEAARTLLNVFFNHLSSIDLAAYPVPNAILDLEYIMR